MDTVMKPDCLRTLAMFLALASLATPSARAYICTDLYPGIRTFPVGGQAVDLVTDDFDDDGIPDLATCGWSRELAVLMGNGDGTFLVTRYAVLPDVGEGITAGRFDGNASVDLIITAGGSVLFLGGNGDGTFQSPVSVAVPGFALLTPVRSDLDRDGVLDVAMTHVLPGGQSFLLSLLGDGGGGFSAGGSHPIGSRSWRLAVGDMNGDSLDDVVTTSTDDGSVTVLLGNGDGTFVAPVGPIFIDVGLVGVGLGDVDEDGALDVMVGRGGSHDAKLLRGNGDGTLDAPSDVPVAIGPTRVQLADLDMDGSLDAALGGSEAVSVALGNGDGTFRPPAHYPNAGFPEDVVTADLDGDGDLDIAAIAESDVAILLGRGDGRFPTIETTPLGATPYTLEAGDLDRDGDDDLVTVTGEDQTLAILLSAGDGSFGAPVHRGLGRDARNLDVAELNGDGVPDVAAGAGGTGEVLVLLGLGDGSFGPTLGYPLFAPGTSISVVAADVDGDGARDLVAGDDRVASVVVMRGVGNGTYLPAVTYPAGVVPRVMSSGDLDSDGNTDVVALGATGGTPSVAVLMGDGTGGLLSPVVYGPTQGELAVVVADVNGDAKLDVMTTGGTSLLLGNGDGTLQGPTPFGGYGNERGIVVRDVDGDGMVDVVTTRSDRADVFLGNGPGTFDPPRVYQMGGTETTWLAAGDFDADGGLDLAFVHGSDDRIGVLLRGGRVVLPSVLPPVTLGVLYGASLRTTGGAAPHGYSLISGTLPAGLVLGPGGFISGVPAALGTFTFTVRSTDAYGCAAERTYTMQTCPAITLSPPALPDGNLGDWYSQTLTAIGGTAPHSFTVTAGVLPPGLALTPGGWLSGTPSAMGSFTYTVTATDATGCSGSIVYGQDVKAPLTDFVVGQGLAAPNANRVRVFDGTAAARVDVIAYGAGSWGASVASGDLDGNVFAEMVTGPGPGPVLGPQVRGFRRDGTPMGKVNFYAYGTLRYGVEPGAGLLDGDGFHEILTGAGAGAVFGPHVRGFDVDASLAKPIAKINYFAYGTPKFGVNVEDGDVDGDGLGEILTGAGPGAMFAPQVRGWDYEGGSLSSMGKVNFLAPYAPAQYGVQLAGGDPDGDGFAEIATAPGPGASHGCHVLGFGYDGSGIAPMPGCDAVPFPSTYGGRVGLGDMDDDGRAELLVSPGPDGGAAAEVLAYSYDGTALAPHPGTPLAAFPGAYGCNPTGGRLGH